MFFVLELKSELKSELKFLFDEDEGVAGVIIYVALRDESGRVPKIQEYTSCALCDAKVIEKLCAMLVGNVSNRF